MLPLGVALLVILTLPGLSIAPPRPLLLPAALCFAAFGLWGIADRAGVRALRALAAVIGVLAAVALAGAIVAVGVGRVIS
jgi:hypothetical protein